MKLVLAVVQMADAGRVTQALTEVGLGVTRLASRGGFLREGSATLLIGLEEERLDEALTVIRRHARARTKRMHPSDLLVPAGEVARHGPDWVEVEVGGAVVFVLEVERMERC